MRRPGDAVINEGSSVFFVGVLFCLGMLGMPVYLDEGSTLNKIGVKFITISVAKYNRVLLNIIEC